MVPSFYSPTNYEAPIRKNSSFYRNAAFLQHALSKRPSVLDLGHLLHDPAEPAFDISSSISIEPKQVRISFMSIANDIRKNRNRKRSDLKALWMIRGSN